MFPGVADVLFDSGFNVQLQNTSDISDNFGTVIKNIEVTRGPVVRLYAIFIILVICEYPSTATRYPLYNWATTGLVTLTFMATCVLNVFFGKGISSGVLVLPMGTLFAFTQLRATLPGAPEGFGAWTLSIARCMHSCFESILWHLPQAP